MVDDERKKEPPCCRRFFGFDDDMRKGAGLPCRPRSGSLGFKTIENEQVRVVQIVVNAQNKAG